MKIGELSRLTAVSVRSLRYYEEQELLVPARTAGGHRVYEDWAVDRVIRIQELYAAGLPSAEIRVILPSMRDHDGRPVEHATLFLELNLLRHRERLARELRELHRAIEVLEHVIASVSNRDSDRFEGRTDVTSTASIDGGGRR